VLSGYDIGLIGAALDVKPNAAAVQDAGCETRH